MNFKTILKSIAICGVCCACSLQAADDTKFGDWTVTINPAEAETHASKVTHEVVIREVQEVRHVRTQYDDYGAAGYGGYGGLNYYRYGRRSSNFSIYFPYRNYRNRGFSSFYRPQTIYNYGY